MEKGLRGGGERGALAAGASLRPLHSSWLAHLDSMEGLGIAFERDQSLRNGGHLKQDLDVSLVSTGLPIAGSFALPSV